MAGLCPGHFNFSQLPIELGEHRHRCGVAFQAGIYGRTHSGPAYDAAALAFTEHWMSTARTSAGGDRLSASFNPQSYGGRIEGGCRYAVLPGFGAWLGTAGATPVGAIRR